MTCLKSVFKVDDAQQNFVFYAEDFTMNAISSARLLYFEGQVSATEASIKVLSTDLEV
jgi:hypothetical protein